MVSSIQLSFQLTKKLQGGIGLVCSQEAVSQSQGYQGYLPACLGQLSGHGRTGRETLGTCGQSCCVSVTLLLFCAKAVQSWAVWKITHHFVCFAAFRFWLLGFYSGTGHATSISLLPFFRCHRLQLTHTSLLSQGSLPFCLCFVASTTPIKKISNQNRKKTV